MLPIFRQGTPEKGSAETQPTLFLLNHRNLPFPLFSCLWWTVSRLTCPRVFLRVSLRCPLLEIPSCDSVDTTVSASCVLLLRWSSASVASTYLRTAVDKSARLRDDSQPAEVICLTQTQLWQTHKNKQQVGAVSTSWVSFIRRVSLFWQFPVFVQFYMFSVSWDIVYPISRLCLAGACRAGGQSNGEHGHRVIEVLVSTSQSLLQPFVSLSHYCDWNTLFRSIYCKAHCCVVVHLLRIAMH